jgi:hypothetical protein
MRLFRKKLDANVDLTKKIPIRTSPCEKIYAGNMLSYLKKGDTFKLVNHQLVPGSPIYLPISPN